MAFNQGSTLNVKMVVQVAAELYGREPHEFFFVEGNEFHRECGVDEMQTAETVRVSRLVQQCESEEYNYCLIPLLNPTQTIGQTPESRLDFDKLCVSDSIHVSFLVPVLNFSEKYFCSDSSGDSITAEKLLVREFEYALHLGFSTLVIDLLPVNRAERNGDCLARVISQLLTLSESTGCHIWIRTEATIKGWKLWNLICAFCHDHPQLRLAVDLPADMTELCSPSQFISSNVAAVSLSSKLFRPCSDGSPILSEACRMFLYHFAKSHAVSPIVRDVLANTQFKPALYSRYLRQICDSLPEPSIIERFAEDYVDTLQRPLQPLMHNLSTLTYQVFESDPVKYAVYQEAIAKALVDFKRLKRRIRIAVVGAGRGPLVSASMRAAGDAQCSIDLYAVEKNHGAIVTLQRMNSAVWGNSVTIITGDMREWTPPVQMDLLVSELLGSFGDNELSPECLDGAQRVLDRSHGVSIPASYAAFAAPVSSQKLHSEMMALMSSDYPNSHELAQRLPWETPYVVKVGQAFVLAQSKKCWEFAHPNWTGSGNDRFAKLQFQGLAEPVLVHGFTGYFECQLYKDVMMSIRPETHTKDMTSWFEMYFPLKNPLYLKSGCSVNINVWRQTSASKVWYEWNAYLVEDASNEKLLSSGTSSIHNPDGRTFWIGTV